MYRTKKLIDMYRYEFDHEKNRCYTYEGKYLVAQLCLDNNNFEQLDGDEMSDGEIEMHCDEMERQAERQKIDRLEYEKDAYQYNGVNREDFI